jgi:branched-chain amino acid transport system ATP-binding protein
MTGGQYVLEVTGLKAGYGGVEVLRGIDLAVGAGEIVAVLGSNGVGKTTINKVLSGVLPARAGQITFEGRRLDGVDAAAIVAAGLIQVPEGRKIFPNLDIQENLELGSYRRARKNRARNLERVYETFPRLRERRTQAAGTLSGGEQQMLAIGRGMMAEPRLLILDEPSLGLSPLLVEEMFTLIRRLNADGMPIMLVEQNVVQSLEIASRAYIVENGLVTMSGNAAEIAADPELRRAYLGL